MKPWRSAFPIAFLAFAVLAPAELHFTVTYPATAFSGRFSGRVVVYLGPPEAAGEPRFGPRWFHPQPMYSAVFTKVSPGAPMLIADRNAIGYPGKIAELKPGVYKVQAVIDRDLGGRAIGTSPGNIVSRIAVLNLDPSKDQAVSIECASVVPEPSFKNTQTVKEARIKSKLLTRFYGRPTEIRAAVILPEEWRLNPRAKFPIMYEVPGFGGDYETLSGQDVPPGATSHDGVPFIEVFLDPNVPTGHCVFADSANNGPWGEALTKEFIPAVEKQYRAIGTGSTRYVGGHSSGGWSSLWLQVTYPDVFGGVWSTSPDPVDFHAFQLVDIYRPGANMFTDQDGKPIPLARQGIKPVIFTKAFSDMERPIRGEQLGSFEAVFSPRGADGQPEQLWNRDTGAIDPAVADAWMKYDIAKKLRAEWPTLGPKLQGKLHVYCGDMDTFYLDGAVKLLRAEMLELGSDAKVEMVPGDHGTMMTRALRTRMDKEIAEQYRASSTASPGRF